MTRASTVVNWLGCVYPTGGVTLRTELPTLTGVNCTVASLDPPVMVADAGSVPADGVSLVNGTLRLKPAASGWVETKVPDASSSAVETVTGWDPAATVVLKGAPCPNTLEIITPERAWVTAPEIDT